MSVRGISLLFASTRHIGIGWEISVADCGWMGKVIKLTIFVVRSGESIRFYISGFLLNGQTVSII